jgi:hypothetical protein
MQKNASAFLLLDREAIPQPVAAGRFQVFLAAAARGVL